MIYVLYKFVVKLEILYFFFFIQFIEKYVRKDGD